MRRRPLVTTVVLVMTLVGCSTEAPAAKAPVASAPPSADTSPTASTPSAPSSAPTTTTAPPVPTTTPDAEPVRRTEAARLLNTGVRSLLATGNVDFRLALSGSGTTLLEITGRSGLLEPASWRAAGSVPRWLAEAAGVRPVALTAADEDQPVRFDVRAPATGGVFLQMTDWPEPLTGCWLRLGRGEVPLGFLAMTPRYPAYVNLLGYVRARGFRPGEVGSADDRSAVVEATLPLDVAVSLLSGQAVQSLDLPPTGLRRTSVDVTVYFEEGVVSDVAVEGGALLEAVRSLGAEPDEGTVAGLDLLRIGVRYTVGPQGADPTPAPEASLVMAGTAQMDEGCRGGA